MGSIMRDAGSYRSLCGQCKPELVNVSAAAHASMGCMGIWTGDEIIGARYGLF
ncbi:hypothetical protein OBBRIDRAFT_794088 [Obba rivulosa]|uniref:Uncharacterized protein n=1 Tax=Obba rivulosa TaxID=1052685 RepID=A0A8E2DJP6_9APHY|nr:hypothetical protein OBBRIDRAFT_794088 [Obba rivulosa]